jgi:hypothetical protein
MTATAVAPEAEVTTTTTTTQGLGGQPTVGEPAPKHVKAKAEPKPAEPRYAEGMDDLSTKVLAAREAVGRKTLAEFADQSQSAIWRWERSRVHPTEADAIRALVKRIENGELPVPEPKQSQGSKADLIARIETAVDLLGKSRGDKKVTKIALVDQVLAVLNPQS